VLRFGLRLDLVLRYIVVFAGNAIDVMLTHDHADNSPLLLDVLLLPFLHFPSALIHRLLQRDDENHQLRDVISKHWVSVRVMVRVRFSVQAVYAGNTIDIMLTHDHTNETSLFQDHTESLATFYPSIGRSVSGDRTVGKDFFPVNAKTSQHTILKRHCAMHSESSDHHNIDSQKITKDWGWTGTPCDTLATWLQVQLVPGWKSRN